MFAIGCIAASNYNCVTIGQYYAAFCIIFFLLACLRVASTRACFSMVKTQMASKYEMPART